MGIKRGDIYYIDRSPYYQTTGSEQQPGRPAIVVSNDANNEHSETVKVVEKVVEKIVEKPVPAEAPELPFVDDGGEAVVRLETERDMYKNLYEQMLERLLTRA